MIHHLSSQPASLPRGTPATQQASRRNLAKAVLGGALALLMLASCATLSSGTPEEQVKARAEQRWATLIKGDFDGAYAFTQPSYRALVSKDEYKKRFGSGGQWKEAQVHSVQCEAERCTVRIRLTTLNMVPQFSRTLPTITGFFDETWVRDEGQWWYYQAL